MNRVGKPTPGNVYPPGSPPSLKPKLVYPPGPGSLGSPWVVVRHPDAYPDVKKNKFVPTMAVKMNPLYLAE